MKKVVLRADGNETIGLGHVYRCLAIAQRLNKYFDFIFAIQEPAEEIINLIQPYASVQILKRTTEFKSEANELAQVLQNKTDIVVLDGYNFDTAYQKLLRQNGLKLISIDDDQPFHYVSDAVINHAEFLPPGKISTESYTKIFTGLNYSLLRNEFVALESSERMIRQINNLFICFGGADSNNITVKFLKAALNTQAFSSIVVLTGAAYQYQESIRQISKEQPGVRLYSNVSVDKVVQLIESCEIAIVPASTIALEAFTVKLFLLTGTTAMNQQNILNGLKKYPTVADLGDLNAIEESAIQQHINDFLAKAKPTKFPAITQSSTQNLLSVFNSIE